jgi:hypothetical protein
MTEPSVVQTSRPEVRAADKAHARTLVVELEIEYRALMRRWRVQAACHTWVAWFDEQPMAVDYAYGWARRAGGGIVRIQNTNGRWRRVHVPRLTARARASRAPSLQN